jgi:hypothetical protein
MAGGANHSRPTGLTYPNNRTLSDPYSSAVGMGSDLDNALSRLTTLGTIPPRAGEAQLPGAGHGGVARAHREPRVDLTYVKQDGDPPGFGDGGDRYTGLDRFGRYQIPGARANAFSGWFGQRTRPALNRRTAHPGAGRTRVPRGPGE